MEQPRMPPAPDPASSLDGHWVNINLEPPMPNTSMLPDNDKAAAPADALMQRAVHGAHATIDRLAEGVAPTVRQLAEGVAAIDGTLHAQAEKLRASGDAWTESLRGTVRGHPLIAVAAAVVLGALLARISIGPRSSGKPYGP